MKSVFKITQGARLNPISCSQCIHSFYDEREDHTCSARLNKCMLFGEKTSIGQIVHEYAELCRKDETKCGYAGHYFRHATIDLHNQVKLNK